MSGLVVPGFGACHACAERRAVQHSPRPEEHRALREFYDANPQQGPQGFLPVFAEIAAVRLAQFVRQLEGDPAAVAGRVWLLNTIHRYAVSSEVVGVHGCPRCVGSSATKPRAASSPCAARRPTCSRSTPRTA